MNPLDIIEQKLHDAGRNVKRRGQTLQAQCPAHQDTNPSLSIGEGTTRDIVIHCHAGCTPDQIMAALEMKWSDLNPPATTDTAEQIWPYHDEHGTLIYQVVRKPGKRYLQRRPVGNDWEWNLKGVERTLYRLPATIQAIKNRQPIWIAEGEKDVDRLVAAGVAATCNSGGAGKFTPNMADWLRGATDITIVADRDQPGADHAATIAALLDERGIPNRTVEAREGKDTTDHFAAGHGLDNFATVNTDGWTDPTPLATIPEPLPFPVDVLPDWVAAQARQVADELQAPVDLPAQLAISALSAIYSKRYRVHIRATWYEPLCTYLATALDPTVGKSPAVARMLGPIKRLEKELIETSAAARDDRATLRKALQKDLDRLIHQGSSAMSEAYSVAAELRDKPELHEPRLIADDVTPEKLAILMQRQGGRLAIISTEGDLFNMMAGKYKDTADLAIYLKAWSADDHITDRVNRETVSLTEAHLTIGITVQPGVLRKVARNEEMRDLGLTARFMFSLPDDRVGWRDMARRSTWDQQIEARYGTMLRQMHSQSTAGETEVQTLTMTDDARELFTTFRQQLEERRRKGGDLETLRAWSGKMESTVIRVAGLLHLADGHDDTVIGAEAMRRSITLGVYWLSHAKLVEGLWSADRTVDAADQVLDWVRRKGRKEFTVRDVHRGLQSVFPTVRDVVAPLEMLTECGWLRCDADLETSVGKPGVPSPTLTTHPRLSSFRNNHVSHVSHVTKEHFSESIYLYTAGAERTPHDMTDMTDRCPRDATGTQPTPTNHTTTQSDDPLDDPLDDPPW